MKYNYSKIYLEFFKNFSQAKKTENFTIPYKAYINYTSGMSFLFLNLSSS